jgi:UDP-glucose 4-epimerase
VKILVTGGAGYIGSHVVKMLVEKNHEVVIIDNLSRGHIESIPKNVQCEKVDLLDYETLNVVIKRNNIDAAIHFAAFAYVGESVENPGLYYTNNVVGSINLINSLHKYGVNNIVFSSTCSLYGNPEQIPISEEESIKPINPYAKTKFIIENVLSDFAASFGLRYAALRYFNAAGADVNAEIGESHLPETHLIPLVLYTALGKIEKISVFGDDYPTKDGTCIRDYIHVTDLADAHLKALDYIINKNKSIVVNLGTGNGYSVKEIVEKVKEITGKEIKICISPRRPGDPAILVADNKKARMELKWDPKFGLNEIISTAWEWHKKQRF